MKIKEIKPEPKTNRDWVTIVLAVACFSASVSFILMHVFPKYLDDIFGSIFFLSFIAGSLSTAHVLGRDEST